MPSIVHDYAEIAKALEGDNWWKPKPVETVPLMNAPCDSEMPLTQPNRYDGIDRSPSPWWSSKRE